MSSVEDIRSRIKWLIGKYEPNKTESLDELMKKWKGREKDLNKTLSEKFNEKIYDVKSVSLKKKYSIGHKIGTGGFAVVRECKIRKGWKGQILHEKMENKEDTSNNDNNDNDKHKQLYALKVINKTNLQKDDLVILESEVAIMRLMASFDTDEHSTPEQIQKKMQLGNSENIVRLHDVFDSRSKLCLVLDLCSGGELFDRIIEKGHFNEKMAAQSFRQMCEALSFMHNLQIVHRDLKPENLLFASKLDSSALKLIDFGLAGSCKDGPLKTPCGTPNYVAPEILRRQPYGIQVDMWSAGVILYIILCGFPPFYDENDDLGRLYRKIKRADYDMPSPYWDSISDDAKDLVRKLLKPDPKKRLKAHEALKHPWIENASDKNVISKDRLANLKRFQYIRRLRRGVRAIVAVLRLIDALSTTDAAPVVDNK